jgi:drug/metabolite transporter (DMT)-like permease
MSQRIQGYVYLTLAMTTVGSTVIASKVIASGLPPFTATAIRFAIALPFFWVLMRGTGARLPVLRRRDWLLLLVQAGAGSVGYTTLLISGLRYTSAADAGVIIGTLPIVSAAIAVVVLGERPHRSLLISIAFATLGVASIAYQPNGNGAHSLIGNILIFGAVACEGLFILLNKRLKVGIPPLALSTLMTALGLATAIVPALFETPWNIAFTAKSLWAVAYYAIVPTVGGFLLWYAGAARASGSEASLFTAVAPVSALFFAATLLGEQIRMNQIVGVGCVLVAVAAPILLHRVRYRDDAVRQAP